MGGSAAAAGGAILGGLAGTQGQQGSQSVSLGRQSALGQQIGQMQSTRLEELGQFADVFGLSDVRAGRQAQLDLAGALQQLAESGGLPGQQDIMTARGQAQNLLSGQRAGLQNVFAQQTEQANRQAAQLGRSVNDPILQAQLRRSQIGAERELMGQEQAMTQQIASSLPMQRLQFQQQRAGVLSGLGNQASTLRSNLLGVGSNIQNQLNQLRVAGATTTTQSGGGLAGALTGALGGAGAGLGVLRGMRGL